MTNNPTKLQVVLSHACILCGERFLPLLQGLSTLQTKKKKPQATTKQKTKTHPTKTQTKKPPRNKENPSTGKQIHVVCCNSCFFKQEVGLQEPVASLLIYSSGRGHKIDFILPSKLRQLWNWKGAQWILQVCHKVLTLERGGRVRGKLQFLE